MTDVSKVQIPSIRCKQPFPTYFISHGGPTLINEDDPLTDKGAYHKLKELGQEILLFEPDYLIVLSGHYQSNEPNTIEISVNKDNDYENNLIYDFMGFPPEMYKQKFKSHGDLFVSLMVYRELVKHKFNAKIVDRGLDHGVWVPLKVMFGDELKVPLVQISLPYSDDFNDSYRLGQCLKSLKDRLIWNAALQVDLKGLVICSGTSVHNLRDLSRSRTFPGKVMPYVEQFHQLILSTFEKSTPLTILQNLNNFKKDNNFKQLLCQAHPTLDHFLPFVVAAGTDDGRNDFEQVYCNGAYSLGWGFYKFGGH